MRKIMHQIKELRHRIAYLESRLDQVESELGYLNGILLECGFPEGVNTLKRAIEDLLAGAEVEDLFPPEFPPNQSMGPST